MFRPAGLAPRSIPTRRHPRALPCRPRLPVENLGTLSYRKCNFPPLEVLRVVKTPTPCSWINSRPHEARLIIWRSSPMIRSSMSCSVRRPVLSIALASACACAAVMLVPRQAHAYDGSFDLRHRRRRDALLAPSPTKRQPVELGGGFKVRFGDHFKLRHGLFLRHARGRVRVRHVFPPPPTSARPARGEHEPASWPGSASASDTPSPDGPRRPPSATASAASRTTAPVGNNAGIVTGSNGVAVDSPASPSSSASRGAPVHRPARRVGLHQHLEGPAAVARVRRARRLRL